MSKYILQFSILLIVFVGFRNVQAYGQSCGVLHINLNSVYEGEAVHMHYKYTPITGLTIRWFKTCDKQHEMEVYKGDTRMPIYNDSNVAFLSIINVKLSDACGYRSDCGEKYPATNFVNLTVTALPRLVFRNMRNIEAIDCVNCLQGWEERLMNIECALVGSVISQQDFNISITKNGTSLVPLNTTYGSNMIQVLHTFTTTKADDGQQVTCSFSPLRFKKIVSKTSMLRILGPPAVPDSPILGKVKENDTVSITCSAPDSLTQPIAAIMFSGREISGIQKGSQTTGRWNFLRKDNGKPLQCCLKYLTFTDDNSMDRKTVCGKSSNVDVKYVSSDTILSSRKLENDAYGNTILELECSASEANPSSVISWKHDIPSNALITKNKTKEKNGTVTEILIANISRLEQGKRIECLVTNNEFPDRPIVKEHMINITYRPYLSLRGVDNTNTLDVRYGEVINVTCDTDANPKALIYWKRNDTTISDNSTLEINSRSMHPGTYVYTCFAENAIDQEKIAITMHIKANLHIETTITSYSTAFDRRDITNRPSSSATPNLVTPVAVAASCTSGIVLSLAIMVWYLKRRQLQKNSRAQSNTNGVQLDPLNHHPPVGQVNQDPFPLTPLSDGAEYASVLPKHKRTPSAGQSPSPRIGSLATCQEMSSLLNDKEGDQEYSKVVPKDLRSSDAQQNIRSENPRLIYADLDHVSGKSLSCTSAPEATTYVAIDFAPTVRCQESVNETT